MIVNYNADIEEVIKTNLRRFKEDCFEEFLNIDFNKRHLIWSMQRLERKIKIDLLEEFYTSSFGYITKESVDRAVIKHKGERVEITALIKRELEKEGVGDLYEELNSPTNNYWIRIDSKGILKSWEKFKKLLKYVGLDSDKIKEIYEKAEKHFIKEELK